MMMFRCTGCDGLPGSVRRRAVFSDWFSGYTYASRPASRLGASISAVGRSAVERLTCPSSGESPAGLPMMMFRCTGCDGLFGAVRRRAVFSDRFSGFRHDSRPAAGLGAFISTPADPRWNGSLVRPRATWACAALRGSIPASAFPLRAPARRSLRASPRYPARARAAARCAR